MRSREYQNALLKEFKRLAHQYDFGTIDARKSVREVFETLQPGASETMERPS